MKKHEFIAKLHWFADHDGHGLVDEYGHPDYHSVRGEARLARMFAHWLDGSAIPNDEPGFNWLVDLNLYLVEAYAEFTRDPKWNDDRTAYRRETGDDIPDLVDAFKGGIHRTMVTYSLARLMPLLSSKGEWLKERLKVTFNAQMAVIDQAWRRFVGVAYRPLMPRIKEETHRGNLGIFGTTTLMTYAMAGRVMFTFQRDTGEMTYVADDSDLYGNRSGPNVPGAPYAECVAMIEDVIAHWDMDKLQPSDTVGLG